MSKKRTNLNLVMCEKCFSGLGNEATFNTIYGNI